MKVTTRSSVGPACRRLTCFVFARNVAAVREALEQLATHKSAFVAESTQPHLRNLVGTLHRLADDMTVEREILTESLTLYLGLVSHRTNRLLRQLTLVSVIFPAPDVPVRHLRNESRSCPSSAGSSDTRFFGCWHL